MYAVDRTHLLADDSRWLPRRVRAIRWMVAGSIWVGAGAAVGAIVLGAPYAAGALWKVLAFGGVGAAVAGERAGTAAYRRHVRRLARGDVDLRALRHQEEGDIVHVRGRVQAEQTLRGVLHDTPGVYRRLVFAVGAKWVHEAAVDFMLVDAAGERVFVRAGGARLLVSVGELIPYPAARMVGETVSPTVARLVTAAQLTVVPAREYVLPVDTVVDVIGVKTVSPDPTGDVAGYREPPQRATLKSSRELPLVITPAETPRET